MGFFDWLEIITGQLSVPCCKRDIIKPFHYLIEILGNSLAKVAVQDAMKRVDGLFVTVPHTVDDV